MIYPRFVTNFKPSGTKSYRLAASKMLDFGGNAQNPAESLLDLLTARAGYSFVQPDQSGAESAVVANLAPEGLYKRGLDVGLKPHVLLALHLFASTRPDWFAEILPREAYLNEKDPEKLVGLPFWKILRDHIQTSGDPYRVGKMVVHACVPGVSEVLTSTGWVPIEAVDKNVPIAVFDPRTSETLFEVPSAYHRFEYSGPILSFNGTSVSQTVTPNHTMAIATNGKIKGELAHLTAMRKIGTYKLPKTTKLRGALNEIVDNLALTLAIQADGSFSGYQVKFHLRKERKIARLCSLLERLKYEYRKVTYTDGSTGISFFKPLWVSKYLTNDKGFILESFLKLDHTILRQTLIELQYWDGSVTEGGAIAYHSTNYHNIDVMRTLASLCYFGTSLQVTEAEGNRQTHYSLHLNKRILGIVSSARESEFTGSVYCPTVSTGFFLIRHNGQISVTGNSSYGMGWSTFRKNALKQSAGSLVLSAKEAKTFLAMFHTLFPEIQQWQGEVIFTARKYRELRNLFGYPRRFEKIFTPSYEREIISWIPQSTVGCLSTEAIFVVEDYIREHRKSWNLLNQKHDSILLEVPDADVAECAKVSSNAIKSFELPSRGCGSFRMKSSVAVGKNWGHYHEKHNPAGMKELSL